MEKFISKYKKNLIALIEDIDENLFSKIITLLNETHENNGKIYVIGNGGSAATASHMVNDLGVGLARRGIKYFNIESLADNTPVCTALANDIGYDNVFSMQLKNKLKETDLLIAISCSGDSPNIINAVEYAKSKKVKIIGLTGFDGGKLKECSDLNFHIKTKKGEYGLVEDLHMIFDHILYSYYIDR